MVDEKMKYSNDILEAKKKWENLSPKEKEIYKRVFRRGVQRFILMWDIL